MNTFIMKILFALLFLNQIVLHLCTDDEVINPVDDQNGAATDWTKMIADVKQAQMLAKHEQQLSEMIQLVKQLESYHLKEENLTDQFRKLEDYRKSQSANHVYLEGNVDYIKNENYQMQQNAKKQDLEIKKLQEQLAEQNNSIISLQDQINELKAENKDLGFKLRKAEKDAGFVGDYKQNITKLNEKTSQQNEEIINITDKFKKNNAAINMQIADIEKNQTAIESRFKESISDVEGKIIHITHQVQETENKYAGLNDTLELHRNMLHELVFGKDCGEDWIQDLSTGNCYRIVEDILNWEDARARCMSLGGEYQADLASIHSSMEQTFIQNILEKVQKPQGIHWRVTEHFWMGLNDRREEGNFVWSDGTPVGYTNWSANEPNNSYRSIEDCGCIGSYDYEWNDCYCRKDKLRSVCKKSVNIRFYNYLKYGH